MRKIRECLQSTDIEMARLGAHILQLSPTKARDSWEIILVDCLCKKFSFKIKNNEIEIYEVNYFGKGIWTQLNRTGYKSTYSIDSFNLETMKEAINTFYEGKDNNNAKKQ